ncbi:DNA-protecting protein DprA [Nocardia huaxiensis]|uniref:DNA-protecting protein DprA n=1 Tax=Nocardia huaxiensis TaxID=2755382 RepID=A0A7D6ZGX3_9NOCA|nr:DNA-processing protein DprA [Nocardia huaxiensis]QLY30127.1 DNA-protecting protein DprA [Nocardia huaxiensis]
MTRSNGRDPDPATSGMMPWDDRDRAALVAMMRQKPKNAEWSELTERITDRGSARLLWEDEFPADLFGDDDAAIVLRRSAEDVEAWKSTPFQMHTFMDDSYPEQLRSVRRMPPLVFTQGRLTPGEIGVCVVGSRDVSAAGLSFARSVAQGLVAQELTVIAGLAKGIDTAAHQATLDAGGRTVAVLGNGLKRVYPQENRALQAKIAQHGMLLTHYLPEYSPTRWSFPARNVTMSAYGTATVIVEAGEKSGTRIQAREAVAHGRPVILNDTVVRSTDWGRRLQNEPGVYVATSPEEAVGHVMTILKHRLTVTKLLRSCR